MDHITPPNPELEKPEYTRLTYAEVHALDDAEAKFQLGIRAEDNSLQHSDAQESGYDLIFSAALEGHPLAQWWIRVRDDGEDSTAMELLVACANRKHPIAQTFLGHFYARCNDEESHRNAAELYLRAAEGGHTEACYLIGLLYAEGVGVEENFEQAEKWLTVAAEADHPWAQIYLCMYYTKANREQDAADWLIRAKIHNNAKVNAAIDRHYFQLSTVLARRCEKGDEKAFETLRALASGDHGNRFALRRLFYCLNNGRGTQVNKAGAYACLRRLCEQNDVVGQLGLAHLYYRGLCGLKRQIREALTLYNKAFRNPEFETVSVPKLYVREYDSVKNHYNLDCKACRTTRERCSDPKCEEFAPRKKLPKKTEEEKQEELHRAEREARREKKREKKRKHEKKHKRQRTEE